MAEWKPPRSGVRVIEIAEILDVDVPLSEHVRPSRDRH